MIATKQEPVECESFEGTSLKKDNRTTPVSVNWEGKEGSSPPVFTQLTSVNSNSKGISNKGKKWKAIILIISHCIAFLQTLIYPLNHHTILICNSVCSKALKWCIKNNAVVIPQT